MQPSFFSKTRRFPRMFGGFLERRMPGQNGVAPRISGLIHILCQMAVVVKTNEIPFCLVGEFPTHFRTYFSWDWDVHWGYGILTHGQLTMSHVSHVGNIVCCGFPTNGHLIYKGPFDQPPCGWASLNGGWCPFGQPLNTSQRKRSETQM